MESEFNARQLEVFAAVMASRNLVEAARRLQISQPGVSKALRALEQETGIKLFDRSNGRLEPTSEAMRLLPYAQRVIAHIKAANKFADRLREPHSTHITLVAGSPALGSLVPRAVEMLRRNNPHVTLEILPEAMTERIITMVANHEVDIGISHAPPHVPDPRTLNMCRLVDVCEHGISVAMPSDHPLSRRKVIRPIDLKGQAIIGISEHYPTMPLVRAAFRDAGVPLQIAITAGSSFAVCGLVRAGAGIGLINPVQLIGGLFEGVVMRRLEPRITIKTTIYSSAFEALSDGCARLVELIQIVARSYPAGH